MTNALVDFHHLRVWSEGDRLCVGAYVGVCRLVCGGVWVAWACEWEEDAVAAVATASEFLVLGIAYVDGAECEDEAREGK